jgi:hypothetical protein
LVAHSSAARISLLENEEVVSYLHDLDALDDFSPEQPHLTDRPEFRAEVIALGEGMLETDPSDGDDQGPIVLRPPQFDPDNLPDDMFKPDRPEPDRLPLPPVGTALFLLGMSLLGASSAAVVFHDRLLRILGW